MNIRPSTVAFAVMAGGRGERLWPLVRSEVPKVCLSPDGQHTLLEATLRRLRPLARRSRILIVTTKPHARPIQRMLPSALRRSLLVEPQPKNTAACIALSAAVLARHDPKQVMVVLPADHWIKQPWAFCRSLQAAIDTAQETDRIVLIGVRPTRVHAGLGHLCTGAQRAVRYGCRVRCLERFVEKPSIRLAQRLLQQHQAYWNAGIFVGRVATFLELIQRWLPDHARVVLPLGAVAYSSTFAKRAVVAYRKLQAISFDDGVMAHLHEGYVVEGHFDWEDLGSWDSWIRVGGHKRSPLTIAGRHVETISMDGHLVATVGLADAIVVHTPDATLVCHTNAAQAVRAVVARLSRNPRLSRYL